MHIYLMFLATLLCLLLIHQTSSLILCNSISDLFVDGKCTVSKSATACDSSFLCYAGTYMVCQKNPINNQFYTGCIDCIRKCPTGTYLAQPCPYSPSLINIPPRCDSCHMPACAQGYHLGGCNGTIDYICEQCSCPTGSYYKGCSSTSTEQPICIPCTNCSKDTTSTSGCTGAVDRICTGSFCNTTKPCTQLACSYVTLPEVNCSVVWQDGLSSHFLCLQSNDAGTCQSCPIGWSKEKEYCVPCMQGFSCDTLGNPVCQGECQIGYWPQCDYISQQVICLPCVSSNQSNVINNSVPIRGGVLDRPDLCSVYVQCNIGYYLTFISFGTLVCKPCNISESNPTSFYFTSYGITFGDMYSCLYETLIPNTTTNTLGFYRLPASSQEYSCPIGYTSEPGRASTLADCTECTNVPLQGIVTSPNCDFQCNPGTQYGHTCLSSLAWVDCEDDIGYDAKCVPQTIPWNPAGYDLPRTNKELIITINNNYSRISQSMQYSVDAKYIYVDNNKDLFCKIIQDGQNTDQDVPLTNTNCMEGSKKDYNYYLIYTFQALSDYVFTFLERIYGYNNRYILWKINKYGRVHTHWKLPGRVCSVTGDSQTSILYVTFCNSSWVSFYNVSDDAPVPNVIISGNQRKLGRYTSRLIGQPSVGNLDGLRNQALFGPKLSLATASVTKNRLYVADETNCRLVDVWLSYPVFAKTIGRSSCYDAIDGLFFPRLLTTILQGTFLLFLNDKGISQLDLKVYERKLLVPFENLPLHPTDIKSDGISITVYNASSYWTYTLATSACQNGSISKIGDGCKACLTDYYSSIDHTSCLPCTTNLSCPVGSYLQPCQGANDASCLPCPILPAGKTYYIPGRCTSDSIGYTSPCPNGMYFDAAMTICVKCPIWSTTIVPSGATSLTQCICYLHGTLDLTAKKCTNMSTFFAPVQTQIIPEWFDVDLVQCSQGQYLESVDPWVCKPCPPTMITENQLWCYPCPLNMAPNLYLDQCVCVLPSIMHPERQECVCPQGYYKSPSALQCQVCDEISIQPNTFSNTTSCQPCESGYVSNAQRTACIPCPLGTYRVHPVDQACTNCSDGNSFALSNNDPTSCKACTTQCNVGEYWNTCPRNTSRFSCTACPALQTHSHFITNRWNHLCLWECDDLFYYNANSKTCTECNKAPTCTPGFQFRSCGKYTDTACDIPCANETMPKEYAQYSGIGCQWECVPGFVLKVLDYFKQRIYLCDPITPIQVV